MPTFGRNDKNKYENEFLSSSDFQFYFYRLLSLGLKNTLVLCRCLDSGQRFFLKMLKKCCPAIQFPFHVCSMSYFVLLQAKTVDLCLNEISRILCPRQGKFISLSFTPARFRMPVLARPEFRWDILRHTFDNGGLPYRFKRLQLSLL